MKVFNRTGDFLLSSVARISSSFFSRARGLMFSPPGDMVLVSPVESVPASSIHMLFMRFPIDVVWVDSGFRVVDVAEKVPPFSVFRPSTWRTYSPSGPAKYVVELGAGCLGATKVGDVLEMEGI